MTHLITWGTEPGFAFFTLVHKLRIIYGLFGDSTGTSLEIDTFSNGRMSATLFVHWNPIYPSAFELESVWKGYLTHSVSSSSRIGPRISFAILPSVNTETFFLIRDPIALKSIAFKFSCQKLGLSKPVQFPLFERTSRRVAKLIKENSNAFQKIVFETTNL